ncbi:MAG: hypothetical protein ABI678_14795 [Kofleriaceae bacterium]
MLCLPGCLLEGGPDTEASAVATKIAAGNGATYALITDGSVRVWGAQDQSGVDTGGATDQLHAPKTIPGLETGVADIATYVDNACVAMKDGTVKCWGNNQTGQCGTGDHEQVVTPTTVAGLSGVSEVAVGGTFSCALAGGAVQCWGSNTSHELGIGDPDEFTDAIAHSYEPIAMPYLDHGVAHIRTGYDYGCAFMDSGALQCWGNNGSGNQGAGDEYLSEQPVIAGDPLVPTMGLTGPRDLALAYGWSIAVDASGQVKVFGNNVDETTLGLGPDAFGEVRMPVDILKVPPTAKSVSDMCAVLDGGDVWCWSDAKLSYEKSLAIPEKVEGASNIVQVVGEATVCVLDGNGAVFCWGDGGAYNIGDGVFYGGRAEKPTPVLSLP